MVLTVWVSDWQMQCCGEPVTVGAPVTWTLGADPHGDYLEGVLGPDLAATVTHGEDHHGLLPEDTQVTTGTVRSVRAVFCRYAADADDPRTAHPVPGSVLVRGQRRGDGWERDLDGRRFVGYLVEVETSPTAPSPRGGG